MEIIGYLASLLIGLFLGLIGGGGSILTVPVLVYLFKVDVILATAYSLFIVGLTSLVGSATYFTKGLVNLKKATYFGIPSIIAVFFTRKTLMPMMPDVLFGSVPKGIFILILFSMLMIAASYSMIKKPKFKINNENEVKPMNIPVIILEGLVVGVLTGLVGAGGGFLIIPALVILSNLKMKEAVGTSLLIIAAKSLIGFTGELGTTAIDWQFLMTISLIAIIGMIIGIRFSNKVDENKLKPIFGYFILVMGIAIILRETVFK